MAEDIGNIYKTKIPSYAEAADIQAALKLFHYGTTTVPTTEGEILADSLAGHLKALDTRLDTIESDPARSDFLTQAEMAVSFPTRVNGYISMDPNSNGGSVEELYASAIYSNEPPTVGLVNGLIWVDKDSPALDTYVYDSTSTPSPWVRINDIKKIVQSKGDLLVGSTSADVDNLSVGANGTVLTADDTQTLGVKWQAVSTYSQPTLGSTAIPSGSTISNVNGLTINSTTIPTSKTLVATDSYAYVIPSMSGNSGKYLTNDGSTPSWTTLAATTLPAFRAYGQNQQNFAANTWTKVTYDVEVFDTDNKFTNSRFTPGVAGYYYVSARMQAANSGSASCFVAIYKNGVNDLQDSTELNPFASGNPNGIIYLSATDYIEVYANINYSGGNSNGNNILYFSAVGIRS